MNLAMRMCGTEYALVWRMIPIWSLNEPFLEPAPEHTHQDDEHGKPKSRSATPALEQEGEEASKHAAQIIHRDDQTQQTIAGVSKGVEEVLVADNVAEHTLLITEEHERKLACEGDGESEGEPPSEEREMRLDCHFREHQERNSRGRSVVDSQLSMVMIPASLPPRSV